jgi:hypothetical protein
MPSVFIEQATEEGTEVVEVTLDEQDFSIDETQIDATLCSMGKLILGYGQIEAEVKLRAGRLHAELERVKALLDTQVRSEFQKSGEKATEARIAHAITTNEDYQVYVQALNQAERDQAMMRWAMTALIHKSECLRAYAYRENQSMKADNRS